MENHNSNLPIILQEIQDILEEVNEGSKEALNVDLYPIFQRFKRSIKPNNLAVSSNAFGKLCSIIESKFNELQRFMALFGQEKKFLTYLESEPTDSEINELFRSCWYKPFNLNALSLRFLEKSKMLLEGRRFEPIEIEHFDIPEKDQEMILEIPSQTFQKKVDSFFKEIKTKLPCNLNDIFEEVAINEEIYEKFVYLLHLIQNGEILYQKQTNFVYIPKREKNE